MGYGRLPTMAANIAVSRGNARRCPLRPVAISDLCSSHGSKFKMLDAGFEQEGDLLFVRHAVTKEEQSAADPTTVGYVVTSTPPCQFC